MYAFLANVIATVHFGFVAGVLLAQLLILVGIVLRWQWIRNPWFRCLHLGAILFVAYEYYNDIKCPLTEWEEQLRAAAGEEGNDLPFMVRIMERIMFFPVAETRNLAIAAYIFAGVVAGSFLIAPPRFRRRKQTPAGSPQAPAAKPQAANT